MGRRIATLALQDSVFSVAAALETARHEAVGRDLAEVLGLPSRLGIEVTSDAREAIARGDVVIEFTTPEGTIAHAAVAQILRRSMVIGTTGLAPKQEQRLRRAAKTIGIVVSPNMSLGVNVLFELARIAAQRLGAAYDVDIVESHHRYKKDAPSGTAKRLAQVLAAARGARPESIPVHALRSGDIVGDHTVILAGASERLELTHRAQSRDVFALGALRAARFLSRRRAPGLYDMSHVLRGALC